MVSPADLYRHFSERISVGAGESLGGGVRVVCWRIGVGG